jgi:hypothetical protein
MPCGFTDLFGGETLAADNDTLLTEDGGDAGLGDAVARTDLLRGLTSSILVLDIGDVSRGKEAFRAGLSMTLIRQG